MIHLQMIHLQFLFCFSGRRLLQFPCIRNKAYYKTKDIISFSIISTCVFFCVNIDAYTCDKIYFQSLIIVFKISTQYVL